MNLWQIIVLGYLACFVITVLLGIRLTIHDIAIGASSKKELEEDIGIICLFAIFGPVTMWVLLILHIIDASNDNTIFKFFAPFFKRIILGKEYKKAGF